MTKVKLIGVSFIVGGATLTGAMLGWELGMCKLEMTRDQMAMFGAGLGAILAVVGCATAIERSEARAQSRALVQRFERILFRTKQLAAGADDSHSGCTAGGISRPNRSCIDTGSRTCP